MPWEDRERGAVRWLWGLAALCALTSPSGFAAAYVGREGCRTCHSDIWSTFYPNPHLKNLASGKEAPENTGCESCHGPGQAHVEAHGGKASIIAFSQLAP